MSVRTRLKDLTAADEEVLRLVGAHLGSLASRDLKARCGDGLGHSARRWAERKRELTAGSSSRWAGAITKASHDQWALARRSQTSHITTLDAAITTINGRLALPVGQKGAQGVPGGYRSAAEWFGKSRRLTVLRQRREQVVADRAEGRVRIVRGGKSLARGRHQLEAAGVSEQEWRGRWEAARWFLSADGETGKRYGNETLRITPDGQVSIKLPTPLAGLATAPHGRYVLAARICFPHRGEEWADRVEADRAVAYRIHLDPERGRWYVDASWQRTPARAIPLEAALACGVVGVDTNADHLAAWHLNVHGDPIGRPRRFPYDLTGTASHRDAQLRHALTRLLHWTRHLTDAKTREKHGRRHLRQVVHGIPTGRLKAAWSRWPPNTQSPWWRSTRPTPAGGEPSTGSNPPAQHHTRPAATRPQAS
ncbi:hypothetical protein [Actinocorallia herbida]|uniref:hypothetical protein n=1 Tax=Actinocorallia herbida TaxID=58109 RepID=UPI001B879DE8|nr:hypothetical protein [Actinocorallia herbida]